MNFGFIDILFLVPLAVIGIACSYTDIRYKKIFNRWILSGVFVALTLYLYIFFFENNGQYVSSLVMNGVIAFVIGYLLWHLKLWAAGDAKLFTVFALLMPFGFYSKSYIPIFPSFNLMVNLFVPLLAVLIALAIINTAKEIFVMRKNFLKSIEIPGRKEIAGLTRSIFQMFLSYLFAIILLKMIIFVFSGSPVTDVLLNPFFVFALLILVMGKFQKERRKNKSLNLLIYGTIMGYVLIFYYLGLPHQIIGTFKGALIFMVLIGFTRQILDFYVKKKQTLRITPGKIKEGMVPVGEEFRVFLKKIGEEEKFGPCDAGGFNKEQAKKMNSFLEESDECSWIEVYKTFPFAPFMLLAALISISTQSSFIIILRDIFDLLL